MIENIRKASRKLANLSTNTKNSILKNIREQIIENKEIIITENNKDLQACTEPQLQKRLKIKFEEIIQSINAIIALDDPIGKELEILELDTDLLLKKISTPIGVVAAIFESRPDALVQISTLCIKSGNAVILKGGKEAKYSNKLLAKIIAKEVNKFANNAIQLIETREDVKNILQLNKYIDLIIPRGSANFVKYIQENTNIPVLGHSDGICHVYIDKEADLKKALDISFDSKCQYPTACNAIETLLIHKEIIKKFLPQIADKYSKAKVKLRGDLQSISIINMKKAIEKDWKTEYNDLIISIKTVDSCQDAIDHINQFGSKHTDCIVTENEDTARLFLDAVDSSSVMWNCSTRFADGFRYGKGAEVGISTNKFHARGPMGLEGLTIYKYQVVGNGHTVEQYTKGKKFTHKRIK